MTRTVEDESAVESLSSYMLQEAWGAVCGLLRKIDPDTSRCLFEAVERTLENALEAIHLRQTEGGNSTAVATAIAETLVPILDEAHTAGRRPDDGGRASDGCGASPVGPSIVLKEMAAAA